MQPARKRQASKLDSMLAKSSQLHTVIKVHPVEVVLAVVLVSVDLAPYGGGYPLYYRNGVKKRFPVAVRHAPDLPPDVLHSHHKRE